jgi:hypothetical protein
MEHYAGIDVSLESASTSTARQGSAMPADNSGRPTVIPFSRGRLLAALDNAEADLCRLEQAIEEYGGDAAPADERVTEILIAVLEGISRKCGRGIRTTDEHRTQHSQFDDCPF